jgi:hypothetical protein
MTTIGELAAFAMTHPPLERVLRQGATAGYPACCRTFYAALIPYVWWWSHLDPPDDHPEVEVYWRLVGAQPSHPGYIRCPSCLGLPLTTRLDVESITAERQAWRRDMASLTQHYATHPDGSVPPPALAAQSPYGHTAKPRQVEQLELFASGGRSV